MAIKVFDDFNECLAEYERVRTWVLNTLHYENSGMTEREVMERVGSRKMILVTIENAYALISLCHSEDHVGFANAFDIEDEDKYVLVHLAGGRMNNSLGDIIECIKEVHQYGIDNGYTKLVAIGRKGWKRYLEKCGFRTEAHNEFENMYINEVL